MKAFRTYGILAILSSFLLLAACENDPDEVEAMNRKPGNDVEEAHDIVGTFSQSADLKAKLTAPLMLRVKADSPYAEFPKSIHVDFYKDSAAGIESVVKADYAKYFENAGKVFLRDNVVVYNMTGDTLYCNDLWWDQNANIFYTDNAVTINTTTQQLQGTGLWALANFSKYTIKHPTGLVDIPKNVAP